MPIAGQGNDRAARILLVDKDEAGARLLASMLRDCLLARPLIEEHATGRSAAERLRSGAFDLILVDLGSLADLSGDSEEAVARLVRHAAGALLVALSDGASVSATMAAMRAGAHDYIVRPLGGRAFASRLRELAERHGKSRALAISMRDGDSNARFAGFIGGSSQMQVVYEQIERIAASEAPVFITGESGTGKELCAEALHERGPRAHKRLVSINCAAMPRGAMERELFGTVSAAMSGSEEARKGAIELADGATLFLDEIGEMDLGLQGKLLHFLQSGTTARLGEQTGRPVDVRLICATGHNPMHLIAERKFREDLFYRLHVLPIHLPPLRQRPADVPALAMHYLGQYALEEHKPFTGFAAEAMGLLTGRDWPGNVRQLQNLVRRIVVMFEGGDVSAEMIATADMVGGETVAPAGAAAHISPQSVLPMWRQEQRIIEEAIASFHGNVALAAAALELSPSTIYRKRQGWAELEGKRGAA